MKIIIDIPENLYDECKRLGDKNDILFEAIRNAIVLRNCDYIHKSEVLGELTELKETLQDLHEWGKLLGVESAMDVIKSASTIEDISYIEESPKSNGRWIPIKYKYNENGEYEFNCPLPEDGQEVLVTTGFKNVGVDTFINDGDNCCFEYYCDIGDIIAWMPLPNPCEWVEYIPNNDPFLL